MTCRWLLTLLLAVCVAASPAAQAHAAPAEASESKAEPEAAPPQPEGIDDALWAQLLAVDARSRRVQTLTADFEQARHLLLLKKPMFSKGRVWVKGDRVRWDTVEPSEHTLLISPGKVQVYYPQLKSLEVYELGDRLADLTSSPLPELATMVRLFAVERAPTDADAKAKPDAEGDAGETLSLRLIPRGKPLSEHLQRVEVKLDVQRGVVQQMTMVSGQGESTVLTFRDAAINDEIGDDRFELSLPEDVSVTRPLGGKSQDGGSRDEH